MCDDLIKCFEGDGGKDVFISCWMCQNASVREDVVGAMAQQVCEEPL